MLKMINIGIDVENGVACAAKDVARVAKWRGSNCAALAALDISKKISVYFMQITVKLCIYPSKCVEYKYKTGEGRVRVKKFGREPRLSAIDDRHTVRSGTGRPIPRVVQGLGERLVVGDVGGRDVGPGIPEQWYHSPLIIGPHPFS